MSRLDAKISVIGSYKHQFIIPSTLLAPATDIRAHKDTKPQRNITAVRLAQWDKRRSAELEVAGSNPGRTNAQGL